MKILVDHADINAIKKMYEYYPVDGVTIGQSWSDDVYKSGTHFVVFVYCFSSMVIPARDHIVRVSLVLFSCILDSAYPIVRLV